MKMTPVDAMTYQAQSKPREPAFVFREEIWTYQRLAAAAEHLARGLTMRGIKPGDRVALHMMNRPELIVAYYACFQIGVIAAPLRTAFKPAELAPLLQRLKPTLYIGEAGLYENVSPIETSILASDKRVIVGEIVESWGYQPWGSLFCGVTGEPVSVSTAFHQPAVLPNTSGTTGQPKFVIHTPATLSEAVDLMVHNWGFSGDDVVLQPLPMVHVSGLMLVLASIAAGVPFILLESFDADTVLDAIEHHRCTRCTGFPAQYATLLDRQRARPRNLASLRICVTGADACPVDLQEQVSEEFGVPLYNVWAATEVVGSLTYGLQLGPIARIVQGSQIRLVDDKGVEVPHGEVGELLIRGPNVFAGYWNDEQATADSLRDGWYHTGDLMRRGVGDDLWFVSRKKDIIIRGGTNISPAEVERVLTSHPAVQDAAVVGVPDDVLGQRVFGFVKIANLTPPIIVAEILAFAAKLLASYKIPEGLAVIDDFPRNALSKVDRNALVKMAAEPNNLRRGNASLSSKPCAPRAK
jgi:acyl-CoA synthetase (AMP-forming)/AMP-acid ligase II